MRTLNLGSGHYRCNGCVNVDRKADVCPDLVCDLNRFPYPFVDGAFDHIEASHVLEHLHDCWGALRECNRLLRNGGTLIIRVPHFSRGFSHPDHTCGFDVSFPLFLDGSNKLFFCGIPFRHVRTRLRWFGQPRFKKDVLKGYQYFLGIFIGSIIDFFASLSPYACSKVWCYWVGGFDEIEFEFIRVD